MANRRTKAAGLLLAAIPLIVILVLLLVPAAQAQQAEQDQSAQYDPYDPAIPVGAVRSFIDSCREGDYKAAADRLNLAGLPEADRAARGERLARQLKVVLDRELWIDYASISEDPRGDLQDGLPPALESIGTIGKDEVKILLERIAPPKGGGQVWVFAASTVKRIPALYDKFGYGKLGELLPAPLFEIHFLEVRLWQWVGLPLLLVLSYILALVAVKVMYWIIRPIVARTETELDDRILRIVQKPLLLLLVLGGFTAGSYLLRFAVPVYEFLGKVEKGLALVALTWLAFRAVDVISALLGEHLERQGHKTTTAVLPLGRRVVKAFLVALAVIGVLQNLGFNVTGLLAGLGVGGLAIALAAQKSIENLFGGVTLVADRPVRVGDFCRFSDGKMGTVEEIGLRSTRVRTLDRTLVTVPNSRFSEVDLENFAARDRIRLATTLGLRYETSPDQLRYVLTELRKVLISHPRVSNDPARVRFSGFGAHSLDIDIFAYVETMDFNEFCTLREDLYLRFMDAVEGSGTGFAFPSQTLYMGRDDGLNPENSRRAEQSVAAWRRDGKLPFPDFSEEEKSGLDGSADYPPEGSSSAG